jgi:hypothetical protein
LGAALLEKNTQPGTNSETYRYRLEHVSLRN